MRIASTCCFAIWITPATANDATLFKKEKSALAQVQRAPSAENLRRLSDIRFRIAQLQAAKSEGNVRRTSYQHFLLYADSAAKLHPGPNGAHWSLLGYGLLQVPDAPQSAEIA